MPVTKNKLLYGASWVDVHEIDLRTARLRDRAMTTRDISPPATKKPYFGFRPVIKTNAAV